MTHLISILVALAAPLVLGKSPKPMMEILQSEQRAGYVCNLVEYNATPSERVRAYLLVPDGAGRNDRRPGIVMLHDHGARFDIGKEKLVRPLPTEPEHVRLSSQQWIRDNFDGVWFADSLASLGYVVIVPDMLYWGSRSSEACRKWSRVHFGLEEGDEKQLKNLVYEGQRAVYDSLQRQGIVWAEQTLREDAAAARLLGSLDCVRKDRIGCFGWSMGAHRAWLLGAFCKEVKTGVALCWMTLKSTVKLPYKASDYSMLIPQLRDSYDFPDIAAWLAPKPFFFLNGLQDKLFPVWSVSSAFATMREYYKLRGSEDKLRTAFFDGPHHCGLEVQAMIVSYLEEQLPMRGR